MQSTKNQQIDYLLSAFAMPSNKTNDGNFGSGGEKIQQTKPQIKFKHNRGQSLEPLPYDQII